MTGNCDRTFGVCGFLYSDFTFYYTEPKTDCSLLAIGYTDYSRFFWFWCFDMKIVLTTLPYCIRFYSCNFFASSFILSYYFRRTSYSYNLYTHTFLPYFGTIGLESFVDSDFSLLNSLSRDFISLYFCWCC